MSFATSHGEEHFRSQYSMHDRAEAELTSRLDDLGLAWKHKGFDPHKDGERETGHRASDRTADLFVEALDVDVKTKKKRRHVGNIPKRKWDEYPDHTWVAWFHIHEDRVLDSWSCRKGDLEPTGLEDSPWGDEQWVRVPLEQLDGLDALLREALDIKLALMDDT